MNVFKIVSVTWLAAIFLWPLPLSAQEDSSIPPAAKGVRVDVRAGMIGSSPWLESQIALPDEDVSVLETVTLAPELSPWVGIGVGYTLSFDVSLDLQAGFSRGSLTGTGPSGSWHGDDFQAFHATGGIRYHPPGYFHGRAGAGKVHYSLDRLGLIDRGYDAGILLTAGIGFRPPLPIPVSLDFDFQRHSFGTPALRAEGGLDGSLRRFLFSLTFTPVGVR